MRLIDADKLEYRIDGNGSGYIMAWEVHSTPTVPAIPIAWIKKYGEENDEIVESALHDVLYWLINDWEKENANKIL